MVIDADFAEFIDNHGHTATVVGGQYAVEKSGFARTKKSRENSHGNALIAGFRHRLAFFPELFSKRSNEVSFSQCSRADLYSSVGATGLLPRQIFDCFRRSKR